MYFLDIKCDRHIFFEVKNSNDDHLFYYDDLVADLTHKSSEKYDNLETEFRNSKNETVQDFLQRLSKENRDLDSIKYPLSYSFQNKSEEFILGVYVALYNRITIAENKIYGITTNYPNDALEIIKSRIIASWKDGNPFDRIMIENNDGTFDEELKIMEPIEFHNHIRKYFYANIRNNIRKPTMRYVADIHVVNGNYYIIEFESIDFLIGFETVISWMGYQYLYKPYIDRVYDHGELCVMKTAYYTKYHLYILNLREFVNKYLVVVLSDIVINYLSGTCDDCFTYRDEELCLCDACSCEENEPFECDVEIDLAKD